MSAFLIRNDNDLARAHALVDELWDAAPGSEAANTLDVMSELIHLYEARHRARVLPAPDPGKLITFKLRELGWSQRELGRRLGWGSGRVSEVIAGKRALTLMMVRELSEVLGLDPAALVLDPLRPGGDGIWIRVPPPVAASAKLCDYAGHGSLEAWVGVALERACAEATARRTDSASKMPMLAVVDGGRRSSGSAPEGRGLIPTQRAA